MSSLAAEAVTMENCSFTWRDEADGDTTLTDLNIAVKRGQLIAVVGIVGSGKSSLLSALLGDMKKLSGNASVSVSLTQCKSHSV